MNQESCMPKVFISNLHSHSFFLPLVFVWSTKTKLSFNMCISYFNG